MKQYASRIILAIFWLFFGFGAKAQFEGRIEYLHKAQKDTLICTFYVNEPMVKYEEKFTNGSVKRYIVVDLDRGESVTVNPSASIVKKEKTTQPNKQGSYIIFKKENIKKIDNKACMQWVVKNEVENQMMIFYVYKGDYSFFERSAPYMASFSEIFRYFATISSATKFIPLGINCTSLLWESHFTYDFKSVHREKISPSVFATPK